MESGLLTLFAGSNRPYLAAALASLQPARFDTYFTHARASGSDLAGLLGFLTVGD